MENASKALLMGTSILIGVLLISILVYVNMVMSSYSGAVQENLYAKEIYKFNTEFQIYDGKKDLTAHDVKSIINLVKDYNANFENGADDVQAIKIQTSSFNLNTFLQTDLYTLKDKKYQCTINYSNEKVSKVVIKQIN